MRHPLISSSLVFAAALLLAACSSTKAELMLDTDAPIEPRVFFQDDALREYLLSHGPGGAVRSVQAMARDHVSCHRRLHEVGRISYELFGNPVFRLRQPECQSGFTHGAIEALFRERGTSQLDKTLDEVCAHEDNGFFSHQCYHGIGHGLLAWADYDLPAALGYCDLLDTNRQRSSCRTGVFMENVQGFFAEDGEQAHRSRYLSDDPLFPCNAVEERYQAECYFNQTDRMIVLSRTGPAAIVDGCNAAPETHRTLCFESMGRTTITYFDWRANETVKACTSIGEDDHAAACIRGAVQDLFWDAGGADAAFAFCDAVPEHLRTDCHLTVGKRGVWLVEPSSLAAFCERLPASMQPSCLDGSWTLQTQRTLIQRIASLFAQADEQPTRAPAAGHATIRMDAQGFRPERASVVRGGNVCWENADARERWPASNIHPTHEIYPAFDPQQPVPPGETWCFTFDEDGVWRFHDHLLPEFTGTVESGL